MNSPHWPHWRVSDRYTDGDSFGSARLEMIEATIIDEYCAKQTGRNVKAGAKAIRLLVDHTLWMSDSRDEFMDHLLAIEHANGRVLVHGLGLGCYLAAILSKPEVTYVDVVEKNSDVLGLVAPYFKDDEFAGRVSFHHDDAYTRDWPKGTRWNFVWHDIWPTICSDDLANHAKLNRKFGHRADTQGAWAHSMLLSLRRRDL